ncbi:MAG: hypothetical protein CSB33_02810 [Desulfobacterales bacterium]|nr:MAG: hypothetical protein CSB33_02810 [Desulfobacterales bacterium]
MGYRRNSENISGSGPYVRPFPITGHFVHSVRFRALAVFFLLLFPMEYPCFPVWGLPGAGLSAVGAGPFSISPAQAAAPSVSASVDRTDLILGDSLRLTVTLSNGEGEPDISELTDFEVHGRSTSTSIQIVNGRMTRIASYIYILSPLKEGALTIPALPVETEGRILHTLPIRIRVRPPDAAGPDPDDGSPRSHLAWVDADISDASPFVGEQIRYTFRLFQQARIANAQYREPDFTSFTAAQIGKQREKDVTVQGRNVHLIEIVYNLIPMKSGPLTIAPARLTCDVENRTPRRRSRRNSFDLFDNSFFNRGRFERRSFRTPAISLDVRPLPPHAGKETFSGMVGEFHILAKTDTDTPAAGDSVTLSVTVEGRGNIPDAGPPALVLPDRFNVYEDAPAEEIQLTDNGYQGRKTFRWALVPLRSGRVVLPAIPLVYFDPVAETYITRRTPDMTLAVGVSPEEPPVQVFSGGAATPSGPQNEVERTGSDLLPLKEAPDIMTSRLPMAPAWFLFLFFLPFLLPAAGLLWKKRREGDLRPARIMRRRAEQALTDASGVGGDDPSAVLKRAGLWNRALAGAIFSRANGTGEEVTPADAERILTGTGAAAELGREVSALLSELDGIRFGGLDGSAPDLESRVTDLVRRILAL